MLKKMDDLQRTVLELIVGIAILGVLFEILGILFVKDKGAYTVGIVCGALIATGMVMHMAHHLNAVILRYGVVVLVTVLLAYFKIGDILSCFLGIMTLKAAAYAQPCIHKLLNQIFHNEEGGSKNGLYDSRSD